MNWQLLEILHKFSQLPKKQLYCGRNFTSLCLFDSKAVIYRTKNHPTEMAAMELYRPQHVAPVRVKAAGFREGPQLVVTSKLV